METLVKFLKINFKSRKELVFNNRELFNTIKKTYPEALLLAYPKKEPKYTLEFCIQQAKKFENREEFRLKDKTTYNVIYAEGWGVECLKHMKPFKREPKEFKNIYCHNLGTYFSDIKAASKATGLRMGDIKNVLLGRQKSTKNYTFSS